MNNRVSSALAAAASFVLAASFCFAAGPADGKGEAARTASEANGVTIIDGRGKQVTIPRPLKRVVVLDRYNWELVRAIGAWDAIVGMDDGAAKAPEYVPGFDLKKIVGGISQPDFEKIAVLDPDVVIASPFGAFINGDAEKKLDRFGIKVVAFEGGYVPQHFKATVATLGLMFGRTAEAEELNDFYQSHIDLVQNALKKVVDKKRVYYESRDDYRTAIASSWNDLIELAGGINIFGDINFAAQPKSKGSVHAFEIDPEEILRRNPQCVFKQGLATSGYAPPAEKDLKALWESLVSRPGWKDLDAVKNNQVHATVFYAMGACCNMVGVCYLAKWLYPEAMADLDPEAVLREWVARYQRVDYIPGYFYPSK